MLYPIRMYIQLAVDALKRMGLWVKLHAVAFKLPEILFPFSFLVFRHLN